MVELKELYFPSDQVLRCTIEAMASPRRWEASTDPQMPGWFYTGTDQAGNFRITLRLTSEELMDLLHQMPAAAIKAHYILCARLFQDTGLARGEWAHINLSQFCRDLGYKSKLRGNFDRAQRETGAKLLRLLTSMELAIKFRRRAGEPLKEEDGPLWTYGGRSRQQSATDPDVWVTTSFKIGLGSWFENEDWRNLYQSVGRIGNGLRELQQDHDQIAIRLAGYLAVQMRIAKYRPKHLRMSTVLDSIGLTEDIGNRPGRMLDRVYRGLDRLVEVGIIAGWTSASDAEAEVEPDMDDPEQLASLSNYAAPDWRRQVIIVTAPAEYEATTLRLVAGQTRHIAQAKRVAAENAKRIAEAQAARGSVIH